MSPALGGEPDLPVRIHPDVAEALAAGRPVVALESAVLTSGLPRTPHPRAWDRALEALDADDAWPDAQRPPAVSATPFGGAETAADPARDPVNRLAAMAMETAIRDFGGVPATVAVQDGRLRIGLSGDDRDRLAADITAGKVSTATLAAAIGGKASAGTTVSATLLACRIAGIGTFATGGIGGVHRGWTARPDISADLPEIARTGTTVVCAGAKSILDVPATIEALETLGVPVIGAGTSHFPRFHALGDASDHLAIREDAPDRIAAIVRRHRRLLGRPAGVLVVRQVPATAAMRDEELEAITRTCEQAAEAAGVRGPARTPWMLDELARRTDGASLAANLALLVANARLAAAIAMAETAVPDSCTPAAPEGRPA
ncbi:MAG: pseudouridine-5'-phosphate glycosidase [Planctomycetota bacterium]